MPANEQHIWFVACAQHSVDLLAGELTTLGAEDVQSGFLGVHARGDLSFAYDVMLWSRVASRVSLPIAQCSIRKQRAEDADKTQLAELLRGIDWTHYIAPEYRFRVRFSGRSNSFRHTQYGAQWVKDQIVDACMAQSGYRPQVSQEPDLTVSVHLYSGQFTVSLDWHQFGLHQRGYRASEAQAPLRETLAAALLMRAGWPQLLAQQTADEVLQCIDPMCGSGTVLIEAALMAFDWAPGLLNSGPSLAPWPLQDEALWQTRRTLAQHRKEMGLQKAPKIYFWGNDQQDVVFSQARASWRMLGLPDARWTQSDLSHLPNHDPEGRALVVTNPPYGQRLESAARAAQVLRQLGHCLLTLPSHWSAAVMLHELQEVKDLGLFYQKKHPVDNGALPCVIYRFNTLAARVTAESTVVPELANRLQKNLRRLKPWLKTGLTNAYRIYDADLPDYNFALDRYGDWFHLQEYAPPKEIPPAVAQRRLQDAVSTLVATLDVPFDQIVIKQRRQQKGLLQYERQAKTEQWLEVQEGTAVIGVNLTDYLDTGLFLDHRAARLWLRDQAAHKRMLNLFSYTCVAGLQAALGGAKTVTNVDLSNTYLAWGKRHFQRNGIDRRRAEFIQADILTWLQEQTQLWDLIFLDPPTFSNSARMVDHFDVQRDHAELIKAAMRCLGPAGTLLFSSNFRRFKLDTSLAEHFQITSWQAASIPPDFVRTPNIHACWMLRHQ